MRSSIRIDCFWIVSFDQTIYEELTPIRLVLLLESRIYLDLERNRRPSPYTLVC